jgi:hypothetical protein
MHTAIPLGGECLKSYPDADLWEDYEVPLNCDNRIESASAELAGVGVLIVVGYRTILPISLRMSGSTFILDQKSGKRLGVQKVPLIGALASRSTSSRKLCEGYFVVNNQEGVVGPGSLITIVIDELRMENVLVSG